MSSLFADVFEAIRTLRANKGASEKEILNYVQERVGGRMSVNNVLKTVCTLNKLVEEGVIVKKGRRYSLPRPKPKKDNCKKKCAEEEEDDAMGDSCDALAEEDQDQFNGNEEQDQCGNDDNDDEDDGDDDDNDDDGDEDGDDDDDQGNGENGDNGDCPEDDDDDDDGDNGDGDGPSDDGNDDDDDCGGDTCGKKKCNLEEEDESLGSDEDDEGGSEDDQEEKQEGDNENDEEEEEGDDDECQKGEDEDKNKEDSKEDDPGNSCTPDAAQNATESPICSNSFNRPILEGVTKSKKFGRTKNSAPENIAFCARDFMDSKYRTFATLPASQRLAKMEKLLQEDHEISEKSKEISKLFEAKRRNTRSRRSRLSRSNCRSRSPLDNSLTDPYQHRLALEPAEEISPLNNPAFLGPRDMDLDLEQNKLGDVVGLGVDRLRSPNSLGLNKKSSQGSIQDKREIVVVEGVQCGLKRPADSAMTVFKKREKSRKEEGKKPKQKRDLSHQKHQDDEDIYGSTCSLCEKKKKKKN